MKTESKQWVKFYIGCLQLFVFLLFISINPLTAIALMVLFYFLPKFMHIPEQAFSGRWLPTLAVFLSLAIVLAAWFLISKNFIH